MQQYPSISSLGAAKPSPIGKPCIAFYKYDGSNLRFEWSPKQGWHKFGTRTQLFDDSHPLFRQAIPLFNTMADEVVSRVKTLDKGIQRITAFAEFLGPNSFAGQHTADDPMELRLIDVFLFKKGFIKPKQFVELFGDLPQAPEIIYQGPLTQDFIDDVRHRRLPVWEGVIAKGDGWSVKIKTNDYFAKLKEVYGRDYGKYWE